MDIHNHGNFIMITIIRYLIGAYFLFVGIALFFQNKILPGIFMTIIGVISIPAIADPIEKKLNWSPSTSLRFIVMLLLLIASGATLSHAEFV